MENDTNNSYIHFLNPRIWLIKDQICRSEELTTFYIDRYNGPRNNPNMDFHNHWELFVVFKGKGQLKGINETIELRKYCICLIPPNEKHAEISDETVDSIWMGLKGSFFNQFDGTKIHSISSKDMAGSVEQMWLKCIKSFEPIGPELDGHVHAALGLFLRLLSTTETYSHETTIKDILLYINQNYSNDLNIALLSNKFGYSESYFYRIFKRYVGLSPVDYITNMRINNAIKLLKNSSLSIKEISQKVGYNDPLYFSRLFHKKIGQSPKKFHAK